jgi:hypothetical protein
MKKHDILSRIVIPPSKLWHNETCLQAACHNCFRKLLFFMLTWIFELRKFIIIIIIIIIIYLFIYLFRICVLFDSCWSRSLPPELLSLHINKFNHYFFICWLYWLDNLGIAFQIPAETTDSSLLQNVHTLSEAQISSYLTNTRSHFSKV